MPKQVLKKDWFRDRERSQGFNVRLKPHEHETIQAQADKYCDGNVSAWLRYCALTVKRPMKKDLCVPEAEAKV